MGLDRRPALPPSPIAPVIGLSRATETMMALETDWPAAPGRRVPCPVRGVAPRHLGAYPRKQPGRRRIDDRSGHDPAVACAAALRGAVGAARVRGVVLCRRSVLSSPLSSHLLRRAGRRSARRDGVAGVRGHRVDACAGGAARGAAAALAITALAAIAALDGLYARVRRRGLGAG